MFPLAYTGIRELATDEDISMFYTSPHLLDPVENEYFLIYQEGKCVDRYRFSAREFIKLKSHSKSFNLKSKQLGDIKPKDEYQHCLMDALLNNYNNNNNVVLIKGKAGSGKSLFALSYCFYALEKEIINKIIIMINPLCTRNSAKLGYYPGTRDEKLMDSFIGNMLSSKLGDKPTITMFIEKGQLELIPVSDIRGYETRNGSILYLPEAQNMDIDLLKLVLSRVGEQTKVIIDGDVECQVDLKDFEGDKNGMKRVSEVFRGSPIYSEITLKNIYRSEIAKLADLM